MSEFKTDKIRPVDAGSTTTLGESGDTIATSSGTTLDIQGTYSGINAISWDTTAKTADFTAETNKGYFVDTSSASVTVTLPASPTAGSFIGIKDYALTADTNAITIARNGNNIQGTASDVLIQTEGGVANLVYVDATQGWLTFDAAQASDIVETPLFITATGGTETTCGNFKIHTFTGPGTFQVTQLGNGPTVPTGGPQNVDYLVVAGGGGAGHAGGAGAGGHRTTFPSPSCNAGSFPVSVTSFPITVGGGGTGHVFNTVNATSGSDSIFSTITSAGGGNGAQAAVVTAGNGGSGGGGSGTSYGAAPYPTGGSGNTPPVSPSQGNNGGNGGGPGGGAGGGIGAVGANGSGGTGGAGGSGSANSINGTSTTRAGGGGGGGDTAGSGGSGGGGAGGSGDSNGTSGTTNTGGGGGGIRILSGTPGTTAGSGGSGIVIIRYRYQ